MPTTPPTRRASVHAGAVVVPVAVRFEIQAEVQGRLSQRALGAKQECDQQTPESAIAIQEGVEGLKPHVNQSSPDQDG